MKNFFKKLFGIKEKLVIRQINPSTMTLDDWRKTPSLVTEAHRIFSDPFFKAMIEVMKNESPVNYVTPKIGAQTSDHLLHLGHIEGYQTALNNFEAFKKPFENHEPIEATFEPETKVKL